MQTTPNRRDDTATKTPPAEPRTGEQSAEMGEPTCRSCYAATLTPDERERFFAEPVTACVYQCPKHQAAIDERLALVKWALIDAKPFGPHQPFPVVRRG